MDDAVVSVSIRHEYVTLGRDSHVRWLIQVRLIAARLPFRPESFQQLSIRRELPDEVISNVGKPDVAMLVEFQVMCGFDLIFAPRTNELTFGRVDLYRRRGTRVHPDLIFRVDGDAGHVSPLNI